MDVVVDTLAGVSFRIQVSIWDTVLTMKQKIERSQGIPVSRQALYFCNMALQDHLSIVQCFLTPDCHLLLIISPANNPSSSATPSNPHGAFFNNPGLPVMGNNSQRCQRPISPSNPYGMYIFHNQGLPVMVNNAQVPHQTEQSPLPISTHESIARQGMPVMVGRGYYQLPQTHQQCLRGTRDQPRRNQEVQSRQVPPLSNPTGRMYSGQDNRRPMMVGRGNNQLLQNNQQYLRGTQDQPRTNQQVIHGHDSQVMVEGESSQVLRETEQFMLPAGSVQEISKTPDLRADKRIKLSLLKLTVIVKLHLETRKIPLEVNEDVQVKELKNELVKMQQRGELDLPQGGYFFFINKQNVLDDNLTFRQNLVTSGDTIEVWEGQL